MRTAVKGIALVAMLAGSGAALAQFFGGDVAARVNGEAITLTEVKSVLDARPSPVPLAKEQERAARKAALDMLIDDALMRQFLRKKVQAPPPSDVEKIVDELRDALKKQDKTLEQFLRDEKQTEQQLRADVVTDLQWKAFLGERYTENEAKAYFDTYRPFFDKVQVKASHVLRKMPKNVAPAEAEKVRAQLENYKAVINNKQMTFEEVARKYSDCPSKDRGGDLGFFTYKFMVVEPFARAAFSTQVGGMVVAQSDFGMHLIKVVDRTPPEPADFAIMKDVVRKTMAQEQNVFRDILELQRRGAKIEILMQ